MKLTRHTRPLSLSLLAALALAPAAPAQQSAKSASPAGTLIGYLAGGKDARALKPGDALRPGEIAVAPPGARGELEANGVRLSLLGAWPQGEPYGPLDSAVAIEKSADGVALDFRLERGRVLVTNAAAKGDVRVAVRALGDVLTLDLQGPGTEVALELVSGWPAGAPFHREPPKGYEPVTSLFLFVLKGQVSARLGRNQEPVALRPRTYFAASSSGVADGPTPVRELPPWTAEKEPAVDKKSAAAVARLRQGLAAGPFRHALLAALKDGDAGQRAAAVLVAAAAEDAEALLDALADGKHAEVRAAAEAALRQRAGRSAAHGVKIYEALLARKLRPAQAETVLTLLHGFDGQALIRPETYQTLILYLNHDRPEVRELAAGHLYRLAPEGKSIAYDAAAAPEARAAAQAAWRKLLPDGKLPSGAK